MIWRVGKVQDIDIGQGFIPSPGLTRALYTTSSERPQFQWQRRIFIRWEYHAHNFLGFVQLACLIVLFKRF